MCEAAFVPLSFVDTGNSAVSAIMNTEINKANSSGVILTTSIVIPPKLDLSVN